MGVRNKVKSLAIPIVSYPKTKRGLSSSLYDYSSEKSTIPAFDDVNITLIADNNHYTFLGKLQYTQHLDY